MSGLTCFYQGKERIREAMRVKFQYKIEKKNNNMEVVSVFTSKTFDGYTEARNAMFKAIDRAWNAGFYANAEVIEVK